MHTRFMFVAGGLVFLVGTGQPVAGQAAQTGAPVDEEFERLHFRSIGPATMSGRITDFAVYEANPAIYYVGTAHGGLWKTTSNGALYEPLFQTEGLISIGDVTISQTNPDLVWVGAGESSNRQSTSFGGGVYKSTDGGRTFQHMGLANSRHINRIVIHPTNNDIVLVAALGPLYGPGGDRGVYKTTDGGRTWRRVLSVDDDTGADDLVMTHPNPDVLYASTYQRRRTGCCFNGGGPGGGIWKSTDGGDTWTKIVAPGLPTGPLGRIALDVFRGSTSMVYALIEGPGGRGGGGRGAGVGTTGFYRSEDGGANWRRVSGTNPRPMYFSQIAVDPTSPDRIYLGGVGLHMSVDGGATFATDAAMVIHDDKHAIWVDPSNPNHILIGNDGGLAVSYDMSKTWTFLPNLPVGLFYHATYDMQMPYSVCGGMQDNYNWCGPSASRFSRGIMTHEWHQIQGGDGFHAVPDPRDWRIVYTESQNGNIIRRNRVTGESKNIRPNAQNVVNAQPGEPGYRWHWDTPIVLSPHDPGVLYVAANRVFRSTDRGDSWTAISADLTTGISRDTLMTMGVRNNQVSMSRNDGISSWPTIYSFAESPRQAGVLYAGSDDGALQGTRDGGRTWTNLARNLPGAPALGPISEVVASRFAAGRVYVTVNNQYHNDFAPYIWVSEDFGATFRSISGNLRGENVRTLTEDTRNQDVLYAGTETGIFVTLDRGRSWRRLKANLPTVRIDELTIHPRDNAMIVATHGRAIWILDHLEPIQEMAAAQAASGDARLFTPGLALQWKMKDDRNDEFWGHQLFIGENPPTDAVIQFNLKRTVPNLAVRITDAAGRTVREMPVPANRNQPGIQTVCWDQRVQPIAPAETPQAPPGGGRGAPGGGRGAPGGAGGRGGGGADIPGVPTPQTASGHLAENPCGGGGGGGRGGGGRGGGGGGAAAGPTVVPGSFTVALVAGGRVLDSKPLRLVMDPEVQVTEAQHRRWFEIASDLHEQQRRATELVAPLTALFAQMPDVTQRVNASSAPAAVKTQFESFSRDLEAVRVKFGVTTPPDPAAAGAGGRGGRGGGGGGGGGRGGGGGDDDQNVLGRAGTVKGAIQGIWETPSAAMVRRYEEVRAALPRAVTEANAVLTRATAVSQALRAHDITLDVRR